MNGVGDGHRNQHVHRRTRFDRASQWAIANGEKPAGTYIAVVGQWIGRRMGSPVTVTFNSVFLKGKERPITIGTPIGKTAQDTFSDGLVFAVAAHNGSGLRIGH